VGPADVEAAAASPVSSGGEFGLDGGLGEVLKA
jgi:hypothetical protein